jgi:hypothetical protein
MLPRIARTAALAAFLVAAAVLAAWWLDAARLSSWTPSTWGTVAGGWLMTIGAIEAARNRGTRRARALQLPPLRRRAG